MRHGHTSLAQQEPATKLANCRWNKITIETLYNTWLEPNDALTVMGRGVRSSGNPKKFKLISGQYNLDFSYFQRLTMPRHSLPRAGVLNSSC